MTDDEYPVIPSAAMRPDPRLGYSEDAKVDRRAWNAGSVGDWFATGVEVLFRSALLVAIGLVLFAAVRGFGRWLGVW